MGIAIYLKMKNNLFLNDLRRLKEKMHYLNKHWNTTLIVCAMACCVNHILYKEIIKKVTRDVLKEELQIQLFAIYSVFKMFSQYEEYDFEDNFIDDNLFKYDHPNAGLRFVATECVMSTIINGIFEEKRCN